jgi:hypothetical protein
MCFRSKRSNLDPRARPTQHRAEASSFEFSCLRSVSWYRGIDERHLDVPSKGAIERLGKTSSCNLDTRHLRSVLQFLEARSDAFQSVGFVKREFAPPIKNSTKAASSCRSRISKVFRYPWVPRKERASIGLLARISSAFETS